MANEKEKIDAQEIKKELEGIDLKKIDEPIILENIIGIVDSLSNSGEISNKLLAIRLQNDLKQNPAYAALLEGEESKENDRKKKEDNIFGLRTNNHIANREEIIERESRKERENRETNLISARQHGLIMNSLLATNMFELVEDFDLEEFKKDLSKKMEEEIANYTNTKIKQTTSGPVIIVNSNSTLEELDDISKNFEKQTSKNIEKLKISSSKQELKQQLTNVFISISGYVAAESVKNSQLGYGDAKEKAMKTNEQSKNDCKEATGGERFFFKQCVQTSNSTMIENGNFDQVMKELREYISNKEKENDSPQKEEIKNIINGWLPTDFDNKEIEELFKRSGISNEYLSLFKESYDKLKNKKENANYISNKEEITNEKSNAFHKEENIENKSKMVTEEVVKENKKLEETKTMQQDKEEDIKNKINIKN